MSTSSGQDGRPAPIAGARVSRRARWIAQAFAVLAAVVELAVPVAVAYGVARVLDGDPIGPPIWAPMLLAVLVAGGFAAGQVLLLTRVAATEMKRLRVAVAERLIRLAPRNVERLGVEEATALYSHYVNELEPLLTADRIRRRTAVITVVGCLGLMVVFDWRLTLALFAALIIVGLVIGVVIRPVKERASQGLSALAATTADIGEYLRSIRSATVFGLAPDYLRRFDTKLGEVAVAERRVGHAQALVDLIVKSTSLLLLISLGSFGMVLVSRGAASGAEISGFLGALAILLAPAARYADMLQQVQRARAAETRLDELPADSSRPERRDSALDVPRPAPSVEIEQAVVSASEGVEIGPVSVLARKGELVCLVGPSGSGKTTLLSAIAGFAPLRSGRITVGGRELADWSPTDLWRSIAYVEQGTPTLGATIRTFLAPGGPGSVDDSTLLDLLTAIGLADRLSAEGLNTPLERSGTSLSGGERQRLSIVRAVASDRPLLLLDEPTAHLDPATEAAVLDIIDRQRDDRVTIVATHSSAFLARADRVLRLDDPSTRPDLESAVHSVPERATPMTRDDVWPATAAVDGAGVAPRSAARTDTRGLEQLTPSGSGARSSGAAG
ncbi:ABC transporter ATP-binding protein [uncultured Modestobacter sp.]|uniref:ATP-binding cassette domain-containing protein n=1 Tax=uncultured Modestobacter sp. TaxID=380048 RepID=UPI00261D7111|nr:ABC transporter ATP-binding protein [uncultured Modestobacter sp.]